MTSRRHRCAICRAPIRSTCKTCGSDECRRKYFDRRQRKKAVCVQCANCESKVVLRTDGARYRYRKTRRAYCSADCARQGARRRLARRSDKRNRRIVEMRKSHPHMTIGEIAEKFGITKQRVHQLLKRSGVKAASVRLPKPMPPCCVCGESVNWRAAKTCGDPECVRALWKQKLPKWSGITMLDLVCDHCGCEFQRAAKNHAIAERNGCRHVYCSRECYHESTRGVAR